MKIVLNDNSEYPVKSIQRNKTENDADLISIMLDDTVDPNTLYLDIKEKFKGENIGQILVVQENYSYTIDFAELDTIFMRSTAYENQVTINLN